MKSFVFRISEVTRILGRDLEDDDDFFQNGFNRYDSL